MNGLMTLLPPESDNKPFGFGKALSFTRGFFINNFIINSLIITFALCSLL